MSVIPPKRQAETELRALYLACGMSQETTEAAIKLQRQPQKLKVSPLKGRPRKRKLA
jgi:hypothetical protein